METQAKYKKIITELVAAFAPFDAKVLEGSKLWAAERVAALSAFRASDEYKALRGNSFAKYEKLFAIAGGKTWFNVFDGRDKAGIEAYVTRNCASVAAKRTVSIANKLEKAGVTSVINSDFQYSHDGFNGTFVVETDAGRKVVTVNTVVAGGYNIQCLHLRVQVKVKEAKATKNTVAVSQQDEPELNPLSLRKVVIEQVDPARLAVIADVFAPLDAEIRRERLKKAVTRPSRVIKSMADAVAERNLRIADMLHNVKGYGQVLGVTGSDLLIEWEQGADRAAYKISVTLLMENLSTGGNREREIVIEVSLSGGAVIELVDIRYAIPLK